MTRQLEALDAYCCSGGSTHGYQLAGFRVTGIDKEPQPNYIGDEFHQGDAIAFIKAHGHRFDLIHAGPPCQKNCALNVGTNAKRNFDHVDLLAETRAACESTGRPYVLEQPVGKAPIRRDLLLCGDLFGGLAVQRHRVFEFGGGAVAPAQPPHSNKQHRGRVAGWRHGKYFDGPYFAVYGDGGGKGTVAQWQAAMGIDWTDDRKELAEAIPPAYTRFIGEHMYAQLSQGVAA